MLLGLGEFLALVVLTLSGVPIAISLGIVGMTALWFYYGGFAGGTAGIYLAGISAWANSLSWELSMLPLFIFMGTLAAVSGLGKDAFDCLHKWLARFRGSLAIVATVTGALFGAITGSTTATIAAIGSITLPEMKRLGYSVPLRTGAVTVSGILANLIPPSLLAIVYCVVAKVSVGRVLIAGMIPGVILTIFFSLTIFIWGRVNPNIAAVPSEAYTFKEKVASLKLPLPIFLIFLLMVGGIYFGIFSPTEAAGIGATLVLIVVLAMRRLGRKKFMTALSDAVRIATFLLLIILGGRLFSYSLTLTGFPAAFAQIALGLGLSSQGLMLAIIGAVILLGCVMEGMSMLILIIPLFLPTVREAGYDPVWFGTVSVMLVEIGAMTPPIAENVWLTQAIDPDATIGDVTKGVLPFYGASFLLMILLVFFPQIALWLPSTMY